jgi:hypothetical protein
MVDVDAPYVVAVLGEAGPGDKSDVPGPDDADFHEYPLQDPEIGRKKTWIVSRKL